MIAVIAVVMMAWLVFDARGWREENMRLRREIARLSKHPSTYREQPLPYMRRYADDED